MNTDVTSKTSGHDRLKDAKDNHETHEFISGTALGRHWALNEALYDQVERIGEMFEVVSDYDSLPSIIAVIEENCDDHNLVERIFAEKSPSYRRTQGFIWGVRTVSDEVGLM